MGSGEQEEPWGNRFQGAPGPRPHRELGPVRVQNSGLEPVDPVPIPALSHKVAMPSLTSSSSSVKWGHNSNDLTAVTRIK